jgi:hypothetical protein
VLHTEEKRNISGCMNWVEIQVAKWLLKVREPYFSNTWQSKEIQVDECIHAFLASQHANVK